MLSDPVNSHPAAGAYQSPIGRRLFAQLDYEIDRASLSLGPILQLERVEILLGLRGRQL